MRACVCVGRPALPRPAARTQTGSGQADSKQRGARAGLFIDRQSNDVTGMIPGHARSRSDFKRGRGRGNGVFVNVGEGEGNGGSNGGQYRGSEYWRLVMKGCTGSRAVKLNLQEDFRRAHALSCLCRRARVCVCEHAYVLLVLA